MDIRNKLRKKLELKKKKASIIEQEQKYKEVRDSFQYIYGFQINYASDRLDFIKNDKKLSEQWIELNNSLNDAISGTFDFEKYGYEKKDTSISAATTISILCLLMTAYLTDKSDIFKDIIFEITAFSNIVKDMALDHFKFYFNQMANLFKSRKMPDIDIEWEYQEKNNKIICKLGKNDTRIIVFIVDEKQILSDFFANYICKYNNNTIIKQESLKIL